ncbi:MFS transporter [Arachidicoccus terrestris]|uniref:MFS transporter n=1 Tax=Arachidicoccus terrestris TaxID=2875539 RepID=UPI001CC66614|nr:MFS transporter [Arachidicoccus terrestris]UAY56799.1 MFS transporter [Arachidicoccus terrestris]
MTTKRITKPKLSIKSIFNMSVGFFGIQFAFALQNGNASRILQTFGAEVDHLSLFWLAAPLTGMIVQPLIGHYSDRTWTRFGRRKPYFLVGALLTALALIVMPNASFLAYLMPPIIVGASMLMLTDASINVAMEPFRALVADKLPDSQSSLGFSIQTFLIGAGAILGSVMPFLLAEIFHVQATAPAGEVPANVIFTFYIGAAVLVAAILWTIVTTKEYSPQQARLYEQDAVQELDVVEEVIKKEGSVRTIIKDIRKMPLTMRQLGWVQFFSWFALFSMWVYTTPAIAEHVYHLPATDTSSAAYADAGNWVGVLFGVYNGVSAVYALLLPAIARVVGKKRTHALSLLIGGISLISIFFIQGKYWLLLPMVGIGMAWGSILAMPYAILASALPPKKMGVYMGIFNFFITIPQIVNGLLGGLILKYFYHSNAIYSLVMAGGFMILGAFSMMKVKVKDTTFRS